MAIASPFLRQRRLAHVAPYLEGPVLDIGCGDCAAAPLVNGAYLGIDLDPDPLTESKQVAERIQAVADALPFEDHSFNTVLAMAVLEHVPNPVACLAEARRVLRPGGKLVLTTPTPLGDRIHHTLANARITSKHAADEHQSVMGPAELTAVVEEAGFEVEHFQLFLLRGNQLCVATTPRAEEARQELPKAA
jgi:SAM-dependent methyltransferase